jgi:HK97 family phage prohead protease
VFSHEISTANDRLDLECRFAGVGEDGTIEGVAVRFGVLDTYRTEFAPSAFGPLEGRSVPMLWSHDPSNVIGSWSAIEDRGDGLAVRGRLNLDVSKAREVRSLLAAGDVRGLSIGFRRLADEARQGGGRRITRAQLVEISVVAVPSVPGSGVTSVRTEIGRAPRATAFVNACRKAARALETRK